jgi:hypothetical protein
MVFPKLLRFAGDHRRERRKRVWRQHAVIRGQFDSDYPRPPSRKEVSQMIDVSDRIGNVPYPIQNPDRIQEVRQRRETIKRDRSNGRRKTDKRKKPSKDNRLDTRV